MPVCLFAGLSESSTGVRTPIKFGIMRYDESDNKGHAPWPPRLHQFLGANRAYITEYWPKRKIFPPRVTDMARPHNLLSTQVFLTSYGHADNYPFKDEM